MGRVTTYNLHAYYISILIHHNMSSCIRLSLVGCARGSPYLRGGGGEYKFHILDCRDANFPTFSSIKDNKFLMSL